MKPPIIYIIEFLIACDQAEYVFEEIRSMCFKQFSSMELYVECLEPFILEGKVDRQTTNHLLFLCILAW